jgi:hypothetical protein
MLKSKRRNALKEIAIQPQPPKLLQVLKTLGYYVFEKVVV